MSSNKKFILNAAILVLVIALLAGAIYFLTRPPQGSNLSEIYTDDDEIKIFSADPSEMIYASVVNEYGSYVLRRDGSDWTMDGFDGITLNVSMLDNLTSAFSNLTSSQRIEENPKDLSAYGLDEPSASLDLRTVDGEKIFYIGDETPDGGRYYFNTDSSSDVYLMESYIAAVVFLTARDYANLGSVIEAESITEIRISPANGEALHVVMNPDGPKDQYSLLSYWNITEPVERSASNSDVLSVLASPVAELENDISAILADTAENRADTGLASPEFKLEITAAGESITYQIGSAAGEYRYILREGSGCILRVDDEDCSFVYTTAYDVSEKYLALIDIALLDNAALTYDGKTTVFTAVDGSGENAAFYVDGVEIESDRFREFYQQIIAMPVAGEAENPAYENVVGTFVYNLNSGEKITLEFAPYDDRNYAVFVNGQGHYTILKKNIDKIFDLLKDF